MVDSLRALSTRRRRATLTRLGIDGAPGDHAVARVLLDDWLGEARFCELFLRYRLDPSPLGEAMAGVHRQAVEDYLEDLRRAARASGVPDAQEDELRLLVEQLTSLFYGALGLLLHTDAQERERVAASITASSVALLSAGLQRLAHQDR